MKNILKQKTHCLILLIFLFPYYSFGQVTTAPLTATGETIPVVKFEQGSIIGNLPYGRHFYIQGSLLQAGNTIADRVEVEIYDAGKIGFFKKNKTTTALSEDEVNLIIARKNENLVAVSNWNVYEAVTITNPKPTQFSAYINTSLKFSHRYVVKFSYAKIFNYTLTEAEKTAILKQLEQETFQIFDTTGEVVVETVQEKLNDLVTAALKSKVEAAGDNYFDVEKIRKNFKPVTATSIEKLGNIIPEIAGHQLNIQDIEADLKELVARKSVLVADSIASSSLDRQIAKNKRDLADEKKAKAARETQLSSYFQLIKNELIIIGQSYAVGGSNETSITQLQSIQIGSSFGSGFVGLNVNDVANRDFDAFSYTALKFYFLPVDKRIADPYLDDVFLLNRLSFIFGVATNGQFNYKGVNLQKALAVTPVVGFGYDFSRYFSIDIGATIFKQTAVSPFSTTEKTRVGPVIGLNFDVDVFNRFSSLFTGDKYSIK